jgi:methylated-DNA-[protein]-cysteine S-methyltransferase
MNDQSYTFHQSPIGNLLLRRTGTALTGLWIVGEAHAPALAASWRRDDEAFADARRQLDEYFAGTRRTFSLLLAFTTGTPFQRRVWDALAGLRYNETVSYGELARRIDRPKAVRALGAANGQNPLSIVIPCHRVIGANGSLTGYGGGLAAKKWLLTHEARVASSA